MDGIFGVGLAEILIVGLALFVVGGPKNSAKWARELGRMVRQVRLAWERMLADMEGELGPEGKELMDAARELGQGAREVASMTPTKRLMSETMRMVESSTDSSSSTPAGSTVEPAKPVESGEAPTDPKYQAWLPPEKEKNP